MDELRKALDLSLSGPVAEAALAAFRRQVADWQLVMPPVPPLLINFGLGEFRECGLIEYWVANESAYGYCGKFLFVFDGQTCPEHRHRTKHETFYVVKGRARMVIAGAARELGPGDVLPVAPGTFHSFTGLGPCLLLEVSMPCAVDDNFFADPRVPYGANWKGGGR